MSVKKLNSTASPKFPLSMSAKYVCLVCKKEYSKKSSLDKHKILCDYRFKTERERLVDAEEEEDIPSYNDLVKIVQEMAIKMGRMEERLEEIQSVVGRKKPKVNVIAWLNQHVHPSMGFTEWSHDAIHVFPEHFEVLKENNIYFTMNAIMEDNIKRMEEVPICCFSLHQSSFYCGEWNSQKKQLIFQWRKMNAEDLFQLFKRLHIRLIQFMADWKNSHAKEMQEDDNLCVLFNKMLQKVMSIEIYTSGDSSVGKLKHMLSSSIKKSKANLDLDFEES